MFGYDFEAASTLAIALFSNAAPVYEALIPPLAAVSTEQVAWPELKDGTFASHILFSFLMLIGRLEVIIVFAVLNIRYWIAR
jgi:trk system potassium uptake protein TrkH